MLIGQGVGLLQKQLAGIKRQQGVALCNHIADPHMDITDIAFEWRRQIGKIIGLDDEIPFHPIIQMSEKHEGERNRQDQSQQFRKCMLHSQEPCTPFPDRGYRSRAEPSIVFLEIGHQSRRLIAHNPQPPHIPFGKGLGAFATEYRHRFLICSYRQGHHMFSALGPAVGLVIPNDRKGAFGSGIEDLLVLVEGLFHGRFQPLHGIHLLFELLHVADGLYPDIGILNPSQSHSLATVPGGHLVAQRHRSPP